jgi:hypothetical protein
MNLARQDLNSRTQPARTNRYFTDFPFYIFAKTFFQPVYQLNGFIEPEGSIIQLRFTGV